MESRYLPVLFTLFVLCATSYPQAKHQADARYKELVTKLKAGDKTVDFKELRVAYAGTIHTVDTDPQKKSDDGCLECKQIR